MSELVEKKLKTELQPLKDDIRDLKLMAENMIKPNIQLSHSPVPSWAVFYCRFKQLFKDTGLLMISGMEQQQFKENPSCVV